MSKINHLDVLELHKRLYSEYTPTRYKDPLVAGFKPCALTDSDLLAVIDTCFTERSIKQARLLKRIADATGSGVGITTHEAGSAGHGCSYNNVPDIVATINSKLRKNGFPFFLWCAEPTNKPKNADSHLWWLVTDDKKSYPLTSDCKVA